MSPRRLSALLELPTLHELGVPADEPVEPTARAAYADNVLQELHEQADHQLHAIRAHAEQLAEQLAALVEPERRAVALCHELFRLRGGFGADRTCHVATIGRRELARAENQDWPE